jgi:tripartite-type tricarboxylate transporter receptor subunit TctC
MKLPRRQFLHLAAGASALPVASRIASAQVYPTRPVRVIVPFGPGGPTDVFARLVTQKLSERLGKQFYVENIPGAGGNIGTGQAARAAPDGHTMLMTVNTYVINPSFFDKVPYDPYKDFAPVTLAVAYPTVLTVNASVPAKTVEELIALIRANAGKYNFASTGVGTAAHLAGENVRLSGGLDIVQVPYNGAGPATAAIVAGHAQIGIVALATAAPHIQAGNLRALAVMSEKRSQSLPDVPTIAEAGYPENKGWLVGGSPYAGQNAEGDNHAALSRNRRDHHPRRHEGALGGAGLRAGREHARGVRRANQGRSRNMGQADPRCQSQGGVSMHVRIGISWFGLWAGI